MPSKGSPAADAAPDAQANYDPAYFAPLFAAEDRHFWFRARNCAIAALVRQVTAPLAAGYRVLEVGCGTGNVLRMLEELSPPGAVVGMDFLADGLRFARRRVRCALVQGDLHMPPFRAPFDVIGLFDVLEHFADDRLVLRDLHRMLAPGGALLITVPAHAWLWSYFDEAGHHRRRYEPAELAGKLVDCGYRVEYLSQYLAGILPLVWLRRWRTSLARARRTGDADRTYALATDELRIVPGINSLLTYLLSQEVRLIVRRRVLPIGTAILALARKE
jgi:SAM-dependent methyltransferase